MNTQIEKRHINKELNALGKNYFPSIPLNLIFTIIENHADIVVQEDGRPWSGFLLGENSHTRFSIRDRKYFLDLSWYKMPSGNYEIVAYVS
jgi:hypothetical protein